MPLAIVHSRGLLGIDAPAVSVELHLANGLPAFSIVGLPDTEVKESRERVRAALLHSGYDFPNRRITVSLAPADLPKDSGRFDLPIAVGLLAASGQVPAASLPELELMGELSLTGCTRPIRGALVMAAALVRERSKRLLVLPTASASEAAAIGYAGTRAAASLREVCAHLAGEQPLAVASVAPAACDGGRTGPADPDLADIRGQAPARRVLEVAAAGRHSLLMTGPPGAGKSLLAHRLPGLLPAMSADEALESAAVLSAAGRFAASDWGRRPFRSPHHTVSPVALAGGANPPRPGEISFAHRGVLFLDELGEFRRDALEVLREPLETGRITIARAGRSTDFPACFQLVAAMNPCPCGYLGHPRIACGCPPPAVLRYRSRVSGPLLDRIDLQLEVPALDEGELLRARPGEPSAAVAARVADARERALGRQRCLNADLPAADLERHCRASTAALDLLRRAGERLGLSGRGLHRVLRVARTIADLARAERIVPAHVAEAVQYRRALPMRGI